MAQQYGPVARMGWGWRQVLLLSDPELIRQVLVVEASNYEKDRGLDATRPVLGRGLLTSEGEFHKRQRRLIQPAFQRNRMGPYGEVMVDCALRRSAQWREGETVDLAREFMTLTLDVVARTLFGADIGGALEEIGVALEFLLTQYTAPRMAFLPILHKLPLPSTLRFYKHRAKLFSIMDSLIAKRRQFPGGEDDLLSILLQAVEGEVGMSDQQLRDECLTLFLAGHETTANALTWTFYLLDRHPDAAQRVVQELRSVLGERRVTFDDLPKLEFTEKVVRESMRLYSPSWTVGRRALRDTSLGGYAVPAHSTVVMSQWVMHRHPAYFAEPERFHPERWSSKFIQELPRLAYFPFGGGPRICVAESFARSEILLVMATLCRQWEFRCAPGEVRPRPYITLRPQDGLKGRLERTRSTLT
jgi:cytochrome P450